MEQIYSRLLEYVLTTSSLCSQMTLEDLFFTIFKIFFGIWLRYSCMFTINKPLQSIRLFINLFLSENIEGVIIEIDLFNNFTDVSKLKILITKCFWKGDHLFSTYAFFSPKNKFLFLITCVHLSGGKKC